MCKTSDTFKGLCLEAKLKLIAIAIACVGILGGVFAWGFTFLNRIDRIDSNVEFAKRVGLKAVIYSSYIPMPERISACDRYKYLGFNSFTQNFCENLLNNHRGRL